ncbi:MAG: hypothetical protein U0841_16225 [Chloroflexia bacterium]
MGPGETLRGAAFRPFQQATGCAVQDISLPVGELLRELRRQALVGRVQWDGGRVGRAAHAALAARQTPGLFAAPVEGE